MKKFFALVLALVMAMSLTTVAWGADVTLTANTDATAGTAVMISSSDCEYATALAAGETFDGAGYTYTVTGSDAAKEDVAIYLTGSAVIKNVTIDCAGRGIDTDLSAVTSVEVNNVTILNSTRAMHIQAPATLNVSNSTFAGKISYYLYGGTATFTNCTFVVTPGLAKGNVIEPWSDIAFVDCDFEAGYELSFEDFPADAEMTLDNCTYAGEPVTETNFARLFGLSAADAAKVTSVATDSTAALYDLYDGDEDLYLDGAYRTKVAAKKLTKTQAGQVAGWDIEGTLYVEITKAEATKNDYYLTNHGKDKVLMYLREAENHGVYTLTGKAYSNFNEGDDYCGQWNYDPELVAMYVDADGDFYTDLGTAAYMLVGKTVVGVAAADTSMMVDHEMEGVYDAKDKLVGVECVVCGATGTVYASADKVPFGSTVFYFDGAPYVLNAVKAPATTDTKVESAQTFDAGIAMYVGMSVMAAAGSAVVIGKKKD